MSVQESSRLDVAPRVRPRAAPRARWRRGVARNLGAYLFLLPALVLFATFSWYPIVQGVIISFQSVDLINPPRWVGLANFQYVWDDPLFATAWRNTLQFTLYALLFGYVTPIALAIAINEMRAGRGYFRFAFYLPVILPPIVTTLLWRWFYDPDSGLVNALLGAVGLPGQAWLQSPTAAMPALVVVVTWGGAGGAVLIYLAALQGIPAHLYEAAELDGATLWRRLAHITLPQIRVVMLIMLVLQIIATMQLFTEPFTITGGGPVNATTTVLLLVYRYAFQDANFGAASALGVMLFAALVTFSMFYLWMTRRFGRA